MSDHKTIWATWTYSRRAVLYEDHEQTKQIGWLDITGSGTWHEYLSCTRSCTADSV